MGMKNELVQAYHKLMQENRASHPQIWAVRMIRGITGENLKTQGQWFRIPICRVHSVD